MGLTLDQNLVESKFGVEVLRGEDGKNRSFLNRSIENQKLYNLSKNLSFTTIKRGEMISSPNYSRGL